MQAFSTEKQTATMSQRKFEIDFLCRMGLLSIVWLGPLSVRGDIYIDIDIDVPGIALFLYQVQQQRYEGTVSL